ncbi:MAG TPA: methylated-DNA--[protein]-cysteine S-methyltransferase [Noviherbaspirillum sp.]|jgi:methylated-DNA-[protein]-cysteine S-methyltransferase|uniref:methylated-DNA--[protein]-cysteine S-methyltransferase n=1 Tax=Noviherbaspirillum sp. TaxID=1926288 RepID=UPI002F95FB43
MINYLEHPGPLGMLLVAASPEGICGVYFEQHKYFGGTAGWKQDSGSTLLRQAARQLDEYFEGRRHNFDLPLDLRGTAFQRAVWHALLDLPFGGTSSYRQVAARAGNPAAVRAAGTAIGRNPVSIIVPCHRVLGSSGGISGYAGGLERKRYLLAHEATKTPAGDRP